MGKFDADYAIEIGGFAECEQDIDGNHDEFIAYNYCVAFEYYCALKNEEFERIGQIDDYALDNICHWMNYDDEIGKKIVADLDKLKDGTMITNYGRTLAEALIDKKVYVTSLPFYFIVNGNNNPGLYDLLDPISSDIIKQMKI